MKRKNQLPAPEVAARLTRMQADRAAEREAAGNRYKALLVAAARGGLTPDEQTELERVADALGQLDRVADDLAKLQAGFAAVEQAGKLDDVRARWRKSTERHGELVAKAKAEAEAAVQKLADAERVKAADDLQLEREYDACNAAEGDARAFEKAYAGWPLGETLPPPPTYDIAAIVAGTPAAQKPLGHRVKPAEGPSSAKAVPQFYHSDHARSDAGSAGRAAHNKW